MDGPIKIGWSGVPESRLASVLVWSPILLEIAATCDGGRSLELNLHKCFADLHSHGEWFKADPRLTDAVEKIAAGVPVEQAVDLADMRGSIASGKKRRLPDCVRRRMSYSARVRHAENRAEKATGRRCFAPKDVSQILREWDRECQPTDEQVARLDAFVADPVAICISYRQWMRAA
jgi:hypothetical protein